MARRRILVDGFNLGLETGTGIATYARNLTFSTHAMGYETDVLYGVRAASGVNPLLREISFFESATGGLPPWLAAVPHAWHTVTALLGTTARRIPITGSVIATQYQSRMPYFDAIWNSPDVFARSERQFAVSQVIAPARMRVRIPRRPDIAHWTYPLPIYVPGARNIYTIHDLVPLRLPYATRDNKRLFLKMVQMLCRRADHIVTVSENSRRDIINLLGVPEWKITNTYQSVEIPAKYADKPDELVKREVEGSFNIKYKEYMLFFGAIEPKKNVARLIEAYLASGIEAPLVIVGKLAWKHDRETRMLADDSTSYLEQLGSLTFRRRRIFHVDYAPFPLLVSLIKGAKAVLFPSLYEGFGLPVLEAMKLGTPVLTSTEGAMREVAGDSAVLVDPYDARAISQGIAALDSDAALRGRLSQAGAKRAEIFSPEAYRRRLTELYDRVLAPNVMDAGTVTARTNDAVAAASLAVDEARAPVPLPER